MQPHKTQEIAELVTKHILTPNGEVIAVFDLGINDQGKREFVRVGDVFTVRDYEMFESKKDAMYAKLIKELESGKSLDNYKRSKYYKYYVQRLKKENPEFII